jgi:hypothetical protein
MEYGSILILRWIAHVPEIVFLLGGFQPNFYMYFFLP